MTRGTSARSIGLASLTVAAVLSLAACGGGSSASGGDDNTEPAAASSEPAASSSATAAGLELGGEAPATDGASPLPADSARGDDVDFVTSPPTTTTSTTTTTLPPTTTSSTTTSTTTSTSTSTTTSTTTTSTSTTTTEPPPTTVRCSFDADALFEPGEAVLTDEAVAELARLAGEVGTDVLGVRVEGHTDHRGSDEDNLALSEARAAAAAAALADAGIDETLITVVGLGETDARQPSASGDPSDAQMAADRRVDIVVDADVPITASC